MAYETHIRPSRDLRNHYAEITRLLKDKNQVVITNNGRGEAVMIPFDEFSEYEKYLHQKYVAEKLEEAERQANDPNTTWSSHTDVWKRISKHYGL